MSRLPVRAAHELELVTQERDWLIDELWTDQAVGIVGGEPKCCKSFLALEMAVSVAGGVPCLRRFPAARAGRVLLFAAEDAPHVVRRRLEGISVAAGLPLDALDIQVIVAPSLRLDLETDRRDLTETVAELRPRLLILDPFVRLHRVDENASGDVAPLLACLRELQRRYQAAVVVVHHAKKGAAGVRAGQALRGSSEFHAWGDSNLYLRRHGDRLALTVEHRAAPSMCGISLQLAAQGDALALQVAADLPSRAHERIEPAERILDALASADGPTSTAALRDRVRIRTATLCHVLAVLVEQGRVVRSGEGYALAA